MADQDDEGAAGLGSVSAPVGDEAATLPEIVPEGGGTPSGGRRPRWLVPVVVAMVAVVVVVAGLVGWRVVENRRHDEALDSCSRAVKALQGKTGSAQMAGWREAAGIKAGQVKDAKTVAAMRRSVEAADGLRLPTVRCKASMSTDGLNEAAGRAKKLDGEYAAVSKAVDAVLASRDAKALDDAKAALNVKREDASRLLADSDGKVTDAAVRDGLQQAINQAGQSKADTAKACRDAADALQAAIDRVNASVQAKSQADQQAAAQAQAAQQQAQRQGAARRRQASSSNGRRGSTPSHRSSVNRSDGSGSAPAPSRAQNGGGSDSSLDDWINHVDPSPCKKGEACGFG